MSSKRGAIRRPKKVIETDPSTAPVVNTTPLTMDAILARLNGDPPPREILKIANIPLGGHKGKLSETQQLENIMKNKPPMKKVRKFINAYIDRMNKEEKSQGPEYRCMLTQ